MFAQQQNSCVVGEIIRMTHRATIESIVAAHHRTEEGEREGIKCESQIERDME